MLNRNLVEAAFEDWYRELCLRNQPPEILAVRPDKLLFSAFKAAYTRGYAQGIIEGEERAEARRVRLAQSRDLSPRPQGRPPQSRREPEGTVLTGTNPSGTASATHIPIIIEGTITTPEPELDRTRPVGEYTDRDPD